MVVLILLKRIIILEGISRHHFTTMLSPRLSTSDTRAKFSYGPSMIKCTQRSGKARNRLSNNLAIPNLVLDTLCHKRLVNQAIASVLRRLSEHIILRKSSCSPRDYTEKDIRILTVRISVLLSRVCTV